MRAFVVSPANIAVVAFRYESSNVQRSSVKNGMLGFQDHIICGSGMILSTKRNPSESGRRGDNGVPIRAPFSIIIVHIDHGDACVVTMILEPGNIRAQYRNGLHER